MRKVVYGGAMSLDGFIAGPNGEYDWIVDGSRDRFRGADGPVRYLPDRPEDVRGDAEDGRRRAAGSGDREHRLFADAPAR